jgi:LPS sulfotransferase NodH
MSIDTNRLRTARPMNRLKRAINRTALAARYLLHPRRKQTPLFILAEPRTGSTLLGDYLNSLSGVAIAGEILSPTLPVGLSPHGSSKQSALRHIAWSIGALGEEIAGAKFLLDQLELHGVTLEDLRQKFPTARYLLIYRASLVEQFVSFQVAKKTSKWVGRGNDERYQGKIHVDPQEFTAFCRRERDKYAALLSHDWLTQCAQLVCYEELAANPQAVFDRVVLPLLGRTSSPVATSMVKQIDRDMRDVIENYTEVEPLLHEQGAQHYTLPQSS